MTNTILSLDVFEQRFRSMFKEAPFAAALFSGEDFLIEMANDATLMLWGKDESVIGKPLLEGVPEAEGQEVYEHLVYAYKTGQAVEGRERTALVNVEGAFRRVYVTFIFKPIRDEHDLVVGVLAVGYDVTDEVITKQKLEQSETRARIAIESVGFGAFEKDLETGIAYSSPRFNEIFGFRGDELHKDYVSRIHPDDLRLREAAHRKGRREGTFSYEARVIVPGKNEKRWVKINGTYLFNKNHKPVKLIGTVVDVTDERLAIKALRESEERFRTLITETPEVGVALYVGPEIRIQYVNHVMLRFWNKDETIIGRTFREALPVMDGQPFLKILEHVFKTGSTYSGREERMFLETFGKVSLRYFNYTYKALRDSAGNVYGIHHMAVDVTELVKSKLALVEREASVRNLFEQTPIGIAVFKGPAMVIDMVNNSTLSLWGKKREEIINRSLWEAMPELKELGVDKIVNDVFNTGVSFTRETTMKLFKNGNMEHLAINFSLQPMFGPEHRVVGMIAIFNDVTDQVNARKTLEQNEARLKNIADSMPQLVWIADGEGNINYYNSRVMYLSGMAHDASGVWSWQGAVHPEDLKRTANTWADAVKNHHTYEMEHRIKMNDGAYRWHLSRAYPYKIDGTYKWYGTTTDVHDQKLFEMNLEKLVKERTRELQRSNEDLQQFAHVASHDLKEPARKIKIFAYRLQDEFEGALGDRGIAIVDKIIQATDRMYSMINGVLAYASLHDSSDNVMPVDLNAVIDHIRIDLELLIDEKQARISAEHLPTVVGNPDRLHQLFYNLINNSLKFSQKDIPSLITIRAEKTEKDGKAFFKITIHDNGIGFENEFAEQIFTTFFRLNSKDRYEGSGLGLALCKKIVEQYGGSITAQSTKGDGSEFVILLPDVGA